MIEMRRATLADCALLTRLNRELLIAEQSDNPMDDTQLSERMQGFLHHADYQVWVFHTDAVVVGYALVNMQMTPVYVRHFVITTAHRRQGMGRQAWQLLRTALGDVPVEIDVLAWNTSGRAFWVALGFTPRSERMRLS